VGKLLPALALTTALVVLSVSPPAAAEPAVESAADPAPDGGVPDGAIPSRPAGYLETRDGWRLTVVGSNETILPVQPLTTSLSSREYIVGGVFSGTAEGGGSTVLTGGTLDAGYRIGCGINADLFDIAGTVSINPSISARFAPDSGFPSVSGLVRLHLRPGTVNVVSVDKKAFKGSGAKINVAGFRVKVDNCAGQSFIQSYATFSSSTADTEDIVTYVGEVKVV
jgi:hypothetical protein